MSQLHTYKICYVCKFLRSLDDICKNGKCKPCMSTYKKEWYKKTKSVRKKVTEKYRSLNKQHLRLKDAIWRKNNTEKIRIKVSDWAKSNPDKRLESQQRRRAKKNGSKFIKISRSLLLLRLEVFGNKCSYCGSDFEHWDHVKPLILGGPHILSNLRPSCALCNLRKGSTPPFEWLKKPTIVCLNEIAPEEN